MRVLCTGLSHKTAPVAIREKLSFGPSRLGSALADLHSHWPSAEFMLLSTCNRTEIYAVRPLHDHPRQEELHAWLGRFQNIAPAEFQDSLYTFAGEEAVGHLFSVVAGLDSLVPGEAQIVSQVKAAITAAGQADVAGAELRQLVAEALHVAKHVRTETGIAEGKVSIASVAVDCIAGVFETLAGRCVLSVGAGKMNEILLQQIRAMLPARIVVTNRSADRAVELAEACDGQPAPFESLPELLSQADVVVTSTAATESIISAEIIRKAQRADSRQMLLIDLAVPRDIESAAGDVENVSLYNVDDLEDIAGNAIQSRREHLAAARKIVQRHIKKYFRRIQANQATPTIEALYARMEEIIAEEIREAENKFSSHEDADEDMEILRRSLRRSLRKFCHPAAEYLRGQSTASPAHAKTLQKIFDLKEKPES
ncbi:MAG: glutamyl-tRNA reductase [Phycisphaerae bacterium]|nr:glutamyl-tRNA reductase [Phycisphaerae bacterium]